MAILNLSGFIATAHDLTLCALEHGLIPAGSDSKTAAENVFKFYETLYNKLSGTDTKK